MWGNPGALALRGLEVPKTRLIPAKLAGMVVGVLLAIYGNEHHVFQAFALSIVLTMAVGPSAELLCKTWCHSQAAAENECHHAVWTDSLGVAGDNCDHALLGVGVFLREEVRPSGPSPNVGDAIAVSRNQFAQLTADARPGTEPGRGSSLETLPLSAVLRI